MNVRVTASLILAASLIAVAGVRGAFDTGITTRQRAEDVGYLPSPTTVLFTSLGMPQLRADLFLIDAQIYFADYVLGSAEGACERLNHYGKVILALDPHYKTAFQLLASTLGEFCGLGGTADAVALLEQAAEKNPSDCWYHGRLGFLFHQHAASCDGVREHLLKAAAVGGAAECNFDTATGIISTCTREKAYSDCARAEQMCADVQNLGPRAPARHRKVLERACSGYRVMCAVNEQLVPEYRRRAGGACPANLPELWKTLGVREPMPVEPFGGVWSMNPSTCTLVSSSKMRPVPGIPVESLP